MNIDNVLNNSDKLINDMKKNGYSHTKINQVKRALKFLEKNRDNDWVCYRQALMLYIKEYNLSQGLAKDYSTAFYQIEDFDRFGKTPVHNNRRRAFIHQSNYEELNYEFKDFIDFSLKNTREQGFKKKTLDSRKSAGSTFLLEMMKRGRCRLSEITEEDILSFYLDEEERPRINTGTANKIRCVFREGKDFDHGEAERIYNLLVKVKGRTKNQPVLSDKEAEKILAVLKDKTNELDYRDRAIVATLLFTGFRSCDVQNLRLGSINREDKEIHIIQRKTSLPHQIPLAGQLQIMLDDYIQHERPESDLDYLFLSKTVQPFPIGSSTVWNAVNHVFNVAEIRIHGEERGTHIFRRHFATKLLERKVPRAEISKLLGHKNPHSIESYLSVDFDRLKKVALSIESFPVDEEVFNVCGM